MLNEQLLRDEFEFYDEIAYVNSSSISLPPKRVMDAVNSYLGTLRKSYNHDFNPYHEAIEDEARTEIAKYLHVNADEIAFCKNTCDAISLLANAFPFEKGDNVVTTSQEYPSNFYPWLLQERNGVEVRVVDFHDGELTPDDVLAACDEKTKIVSLSTVFFCNGFRFDIKELGEKLHERGIILAVDSIQGLGRLTLYPRECHIGFVANGGHKSLLGMKGIGFLYCAKELIPSLKPHTACRQSLTRWHRPPLERHADELPWRSDARIFESGNPNYIGIAAMGKGVGLLNELGPEAIEMHVLEMELKLRTLCADLPLHFYTPKNQRNYSGVVFVTLPEGVSNEAADAVFVKHKVYATIREGYIRIAIHCMNSEKHMQMTADALKEVAALTAK